jgi:hypothetical protein
VLETTLLATEQTGTQTIGGADMTTAWTGSRSVSGSNEHDLVSRQTRFVGNHPLELPKRPSVELRPLLCTATLTAVSDTAEVFQHNETVGWETIDEATANGMQISASPTAFLIAQPCPSAFRSRAFTLQDTPSGTEPLAPLNRFYTRNLDTVRSHNEVNLAEVDTNNTLWGFIRFGDWNGNDDMQVEFSVSVAFENCKGGFGCFEDWQIALPNLDRAFDSFPVASGETDPNCVVFQEQSEKSCVQVQRLGFEIQKFQGSLFGFGGFVCFCDTLTGTGSIISVEVEPLSDVVVGQMMQSDGMEASLRESHLTDGVASSSEQFERSFQPLFVLCRQVKFGDNGQFHRLDYTPRTRICQEGGDWRRSSVV